MSRTGERHTLRVIPAYRSLSGGGHPTALHHAGGFALRDLIASGLVAQARRPEMELRGTRRDALAVGKIVPEVGGR